MPTVTLDAGTLRYDVTGPPDGRPVVFVHGTVNHLVFRDIARKTELIHLADDRTRTKRKVA